TGSSNYEFAKTIPGVRVVLLPVNHPLRSVQKIRSFRFDLFIDFGSWPRLDAILAFSARAGFTIGFKSAGQYRHYLFDRAVDHSRGVHEIENFRNLLRVFGVNSFSIPRIEYDENRSNLESDLRQPYVVFHPWPSGYKSYLKEWPPEYWSGLAERVAAMGLRILLSGSAADREKSENIIKRLKKRGDQISNIAGKYSLEETFGVLKNARLLICVNTGIMHIAAALDVPMVALHGPTSPLRWGPLSDRAVVIVPDIPGCGYLNFGFEYPSNPPDCMGEISVEKVFHAVKSILNETDDSG
ncbi:MAG: glycosyltransferase family 9 protein, partial [Calditrichia bacterium]